MHLPGGCAYTAVKYRPASKKRKIGLRLSFLCGAKPPEAEFLACYIGFSVALDSEAPRFLVVYESLSLALLLMCFLLAGRYCTCDNLVFDKYTKWMFSYTLTQTCGITVQRCI